MKRTFLFLLTGILFLSNRYSFAQEGRHWKQRTDFIIGVSLNPVDHSLDGSETIDYNNNSPDTLTFIWFHLYANAFKNDRTAFSEAMLREDRTDFYFSRNNQKGYINRLDFSVNGLPAQATPHPQHMDIAKLVLPSPLLPGHTVRITTPFHIQLPYNFQGNGYSDQHYRIAHWFPKPAIYDSTGWQVMPYRMQKNTGTETGHYRVQITVPEDYTILPECPEALLTGTIHSASGTTITATYVAENATDFIWQTQSKVPAPPAAPGHATAQMMQDSSTAWLNKTGRKLAAQVFDTSRKRNLSLLPMAGYNRYDGLMLGGLLHNYLAPDARLRFLAIPFYSFESKGLNGLGRISYSYPGSGPVAVNAGLAFSRFSKERTVASAVPQHFLHFTKLAPFIRFELKEKGSSGKLSRFAELKYFSINEEDPLYKEVTNGPDTYLSADVESSHTSLVRLVLGVENSRKLYPYKGIINIENHRNFMRFGFTGRYYFNFANNVNGLEVRVFAGKLLYTRTVSSFQRFMDSRYYLNLTGTSGEEDYTYSNYFIGRNEFEGWNSQQIMIRDGGFKVRTDLLSDKIGKTDNWLSAVNFSTWIPDKVNPLKLLPIKIPVKLFADIGTYAETWDSEADADRFLFDAGLQLSLFNEIVNVYFPIFYSKVFKDYFRSSLGDQRFWKTVSFSIDIQRINWKKMTGLGSL